MPDPLYLTLIKPMSDLGFFETQKSRRMATDKWGKWKPWPIPWPGPLWHHFLFLAWGSCRIWAILTLDFAANEGRKNLRSESQTKTRQGTTLCILDFVMFYNSPVWSETILKEMIESSEIELQGFLLVYYPHHDNYTPRRTMF